MSVLSKFRTDQIYKTVDGLKYISQYVHLEKTGQVYKGKCPFHLEKTASFTVYPKGYISSKGKQERTQFYCYGCGAFGDIIEFRKRLDFMSSREEAAAYIEKEFDLQNDEDEYNEFLKHEAEEMKTLRVKSLTLEQQLLLISSFCRNYLRFIQKEKSDVYDEEEKFIDDYYKYFDENLGEFTEKEIRREMYFLNQKLKKKKLQFIEEIKRHQ